MGFSWSSEVTHRAGLCRGFWNRTTCDQVHYIRLDFYWAAISQIIDRGCLFWGDYSTWFSNPAGPGCFRLIFCIPVWSCFCDFQPSNNCHSAPSNPISNIPILWSLPPAFKYSFPFPLCGSKSLCSKSAAWRSTAASDPSPSLFQAAPAPKPSWTVSPPFSYPPTNADSYFVIACILGYHHPVYASTSSNSVKSFEKTTRKDHSTSKTGFLCCR